MTRMLTIIALLFATPAWALNDFCQDRINFVTSVDDRKRIETKIADGDCDTIYIMVDRRHGWPARVANYCRFDREIVVEDDPDRPTVNFACVPAK